MIVVAWFVLTTCWIAALYYFGNVAQEQRGEWAELDAKAERLTAWECRLVAREANPYRFATAVYDQDKQDLVESVARVDCDEASVINPSGDAGDSFGGAAA